MDIDRKTLALGAFLGFTAVVFGALGGHALAPKLAEVGRAHHWDVAVKYHAWHALALVALAPAGARFGGTALRVAFAAGVLLFSGSLYLYALERLPGSMGPMTPLGGIVLLVGWAIVFVRAVRGARA